MKNIKSYAREELADLFEEWGQPRFRVQQIVKWLYQRGVTSYDEMTDMPKTLRAHLAEQAPLNAPELLDKRISRDGTRKYVWTFEDGKGVETVAIPSREKNMHGEPQRLTVCFSTQVGCAMACAFCATGKEGFSRNLTPGEMVDQILFSGKDMDMRVSNVVAMGQGEPFLNYDNTLAALRFINSKDGLHIGARHITVSTCGVIPGIERFSQEPEQFTLAVSLHSAVQDTRDQLMPKMKDMTLQRLKEALASYSNLSGRRVSLEYLLLKGVNDDEQHLESLITFCEGLLCHINLLPFNAVEGSFFQPSSKHQRSIWLERLEQARIEATVRDSRGSDIEGACGQLKRAIHQA